STSAPTYNYGGPPTTDSDAQHSRTYSYGGPAPTLAASRANEQSPSKSSIVFIRTAAPMDGVARPQPTPGNSLGQLSLLPPGTRLMARLDAAATTAVKTPVIASIEYNYERAGMIL